MKKCFLEFCYMLVDIDNALCCFSWPLSVIWNRYSLPRIRQSVLTRIRFVCMLLIITLLCLAMLSSHSWSILNDKTCTKAGYRTCELIHGPGAVYRVLFAVFSYFFIFSVFLISVENTKCWRSIFHNHLWACKCVTLIISVIGFIYLPRNKYSGEVWHFFGLNSGFAFIILQFILLIDTVHYINARIVSWMESNKDGRNLVRYYSLVLWIPITFFYTVSVLATVFFYKQYSSRTDCINNMFFITFHIYMCVAASLISIHPVVQEARPNSSLLQSSIASAYSTYIMWLTLSNQPDDICNPGREYRYPVDPAHNEQVLLSIAITFFILFLFCVRMLDNGQYGKHVNGDAHEKKYEQKEGGISSQMDLSASDPTNTDKKLMLTPSTIIEDDEEVGIEYSYSFFHALLSLASLYLMMTMTNWYRPEEEENLTVKLIAGWGAIWIKLCSGIFCVFLYIWSLVAPVVFPLTYRDLVLYEMMFSTS